MIDTDMCHREPVSVRVEELIRAFEDDHLNFDIPAGRMTGFVGADGAGKTTTMRMIVGVLKPTSGQVLWSGRPITAEDRRTIGYMPEERGLYHQAAGHRSARLPRPNQGGIHTDGSHRGHGIPRQVRAC